MIVGILGPGHSENFFGEQRVAIGEEASREVVCLLVLTTDNYGVVATLIAPNDEIRSLVLAGGCCALISTWCCCCQ